MKKILLVINSKGEEIFYSSLKKELKNKGIKLTIKKLKALGYELKYTYQFMLV